MLDPEILALCQKLRPLIGEVADQLWWLYSTSESYALRVETEGIIRAVALRELGNRVDNRHILLPPPSPSVASGDLYLGNLLYAGKSAHPLMQRIKEIPSHLAMIGATGSGKSTAATGLLIECLRADIPFLVLDWKRSYRNLKNLNSPATSKMQVYTVGRDVAPLEWNALKALGLATR